jgi:hypothetical protein
MMKTVACGCVFAALLALCACSTSPAPSKTTPTVTEVMSPAGPGSGQPELAAATDGRVFMSWIEREGRGHKMLFSTRDTKGAWAAPRVIGSGAKWFVNDADTPSIAVLPDGSLAAHWLTNNEPGSEAYDLNVVLSHDGGATWSQPIVPHRDHTKSEHGFVSLVAAPGGLLHVIWLDGRQTNEEGEGDMTLMHTTISRDGALSPESQLDNRVCECCRTSAAVTPDGLIVVYRDRSPNEIRDINVLRYVNGIWSEPQPLSNEGWEIEGCPVNGPAVSADGKNIAAAWFSAAKDVPQVHLALSTDGGKTFPKSVQVDDGKPNGHVDVVSFGNGGALVSWMEHTDKGAEIRIRQIDRDGNKHASIPVSGTSGVRSAAVARLERSGNQAIIAWTAAGDPSQIKIATVPFQ